MSTESREQEVSERDEVDKNIRIEELQEQFAEQFFDMWLEDINRENCYNEKNHGK